MFRVNKKKLALINIIEKYQMMHTFSCVLEIIHIFSIIYGILVYNQDTLQSHKQFSAINQVWPHSHASLLKICRKHQLYPYERHISVYDNWSISLFVPLVLYRESLCRNDGCRLSCVIHHFAHSWRYRWCCTCQYMGPLIHPPFG